jgi:2-polyprenyl-3-methyl-5-hydroxy-6-metoxy-1,4-benzoquinol methylase
MDKAGVAYWERHWHQTHAAGFHPATSRIRDYRDRVFAQLFAEATDGLSHDARLLEAGCGDSLVLPYLATLGYQISGVDYSETGCRKIRERLGAIDADIECCDIFDPPGRLLGRVDLAFSCGLVEHFSNTAECVGAIACLVRPGGRILTVIPNLCGSIGAVQRRIAPSIYAAHVPLSLEDLVQAHRAAGLAIQRASYLLPVGYGILDAREPNVQGAPLLARRILVAALARLSWFGWLIDRQVRLPATRLFAPYAYCLATRQP